ncbi:MAG: hypothetical protein U9N12_09960 [Euryarchaeota archaeon]|nr:hypothetical protein [Euryarchaeota archaeon]
MFDKRVFKGFGAAFIPATSNGVFCRVSITREETGTKLAGTVTITHAVITETTARK